MMYFTDVWYCEASQGLVTLTDIKLIRALRFTSVSRLKDVSEMNLMSV